MLPLEQIQRYLTGAWRLMMGKADGLRLLDISADGFWNSFFAIVVAMPALAVAWTAIANEVGQGPEDFGGRLSILMRLAFVDFAAWVAPLAALAAVAPHAGIGDRFVHYVVASNWGSVLLEWLVMPAALVRLFVPAATDTASFLALALFTVTMVLKWRLTNVAIGKGAAVGSAVFAGLFVVSVAVFLLLLHALGLGAADQLSG